MLRRYQYDRTEMLERVITRMSRAHAPRTVSVIWSDAISGWGNERWAAETDEWGVSKGLHADGRGFARIDVCES